MALTFKTLFGSRKKKQAFFYYSSNIYFEFVRQISDKYSFYRYLLYSVIFRIAVHKEKGKEKRSKQAKIIRRSCNLL